MSTSMQHSRGRLADEVRWSVGRKLRAAGDAIFRLGMKVSEGTNAGIAAECDVSYLWGFEDGQKMGKERPREEYLAYLLDCKIDREQAESFLNSIMPNGAGR